MTRCRECHASIPVPAELDAIVMRCQYCGLEQPVPDLETRRKLLIEEQREARLRAQAEAEAERERQREAREDRKEQREEQERKRERRSRKWTWLFSVIPLLIAPTIIAITVFDAPARLGFGASGADRLEQLEVQSRSFGCTVLVPIKSEYASSNVSKLVAVADKQCIRILAAGGDNHNSLSLKLFSSAGKEVASGKDTSDPQLVYCATAADTMRYEIKIGVASKGRLSSGVLACPEPQKKDAPTPPTPAPSTDPLKPEPAKPVKPKPTKPKPRPKVG